MPYFVIKTVDEEKREVGGLITCETRDKDGETLDYAGSKPEFQAWSMEAYNATKGAGQAESFGNVREQHSKRMVGKFVEPLKFDDEKKTIWGLAKIYDDDVWLKTKDGGYNGFSVGGNLKSSKTVGKTKFITIIPREVSIVDNPAVDEAHFDFVRAADGQIVKAAFKHRTPAEIYSDIVVQLEAATPILSAAFPSFSGQVKAIKEVFKAADPAYAPDAVPDQNGKEQPVEQGPDAHGKQPDPEVKTVPNVEAQRPFGDPDTQLDLHDSEPQNDYIVKVAPPGWNNTIEAMKEHKEIDNPYALAWYMEGEGYTSHKLSKAAFLEFNSLFKAATGPDGIVCKRDVSDKERAELADKGHAMPDGSYPIVNASDLSNAVQAFGRAKNPDAVKAHIKRRAAALGHTDLLPESWEKAAKIELSQPSVGANNMSTEVEKAARLSMHDHLQAIKKAATEHKAALGSCHADAASKHEAAIHGLVDKCMKLAGTESLDETHSTAEVSPTGSASAAENTEVKAAKAEIEKLAAAVKALTEKIEAKATTETKEKTATTEKVVGDPAKAQPTGEQLVEKAAAAKKEAEADLELAKAAFGVDAKTGQRCAADPKAMNALYYKMTDARQVRAAKAAKA